MDFLKTLQTAAIHEYEMVAPTLAKVTVSVTSNMSKEAAITYLRKQLKEAASPVVDSFRWLDQNTAVGFVSSLRETRVISSVKEIANNYRVMASNIYLDNEDRSLWEMKDGAAGKYLTRKGSDNLEALVQTARVSPTGSTPRLRRVLSASVSRADLVAFVDTSGWQAETNYGFCVASTETHLKIVTDSATVVVPRGAVVSSHEIDIPAVKPGKVNASEYNEPVKNSEEYYKLAYGYNPEYMEKVIEQVRQMAAM